MTLALAALMAIALLPAFCQGDCLNSPEGPQTLLDNAADFGSCDRMLSFEQDCEMTPNAGFVCEASICMFAPDDETARASEPDFGMFHPSGVCEAIPRCDASSWPLPEGAADRGTCSGMLTGRADLDNKSQRQRYALQNDPILSQSCTMTPKPGFHCQDSKCQPDGTPYDGECYEIGAFCESKGAWRSFNNRGEPETVTEPCTTAPMYDFGRPLKLKEFGVGPSNGCVHISFTDENRKIWDYSGPASPDWECYKGDLGSVEGQEEIWINNHQIWINNHQWRNTYEGQEGDTKDADGNRNEDYFRPFKCRICERFEYVNDDSGNQVLTDTSSEDCDTPNPLRQDCSPTMIGASSNMSLSFAAAAAVVVGYVAVN